MAKFLYECIMQCDLGYMAPDQRKERWKKVGKNYVQPQTKHSIRIFPLLNGEEYDDNGRKLWADYISTDKPLGRQYTEELHYKVDRPSEDYEHPGRKLRMMREKVSYPKFRLIKGEECYRVPLEKIIDYGTMWAPDMFKDVVGDVVMDKEMLLNAAIGRKIISGKSAPEEPKEEAEEPKRGRPRKVS